MTMPVYVVSDLYAISGDNKFNILHSTITVKALTINR